MAAPEPAAAKHVLLATPCYGCSVSSQYMLSVANTLMAVMSRRPDVRVSLFALGNESLVTRARNKCVAHFLGRAAFTHLFFVDADIEFAPETFLRVLDADRDVATACYPQKGTLWEGVARAAREAGAAATADAMRAASLNFNVTVHAGAGVRRLWPHDGFLPVDYSATGFMCIKRAVFDRMRAAYPEQAYADATEADELSRPHHWLFFDCVVDPDTRQYLSEDFAFCKKWRAIGGEVWADMVSPLGHVGAHKFVGAPVDAMDADARAKLLASRAGVAPPGVAPPTTRIGGQAGQGPLPPRSAWLAAQRHAQRH